MKKVLAPLTTLVWLAATAVGLLAVIRTLQPAPSVVLADEETPDDDEAPFPEGFTEEQIAAYNALVCDLPGQATSADRLNPCHARFLSDREPAHDLAQMAEVPCQNGFAGQFPCENVDLLSLLPLSTFGTSSANDIWGWTDPQTGREYALLGLFDGTAFIDVTDPVAPLYLGKLPKTAAAFNSSWRDIKTYANHAYIVSDISGLHGMQVFDLTRLRGLSGPAQTFTETFLYDDIGSAHNVAINEESGFAYIIGGSSGSNTCAGGLHMVDLSEPAEPSFAGCFSADGYTHDTQCVIYSGPDANYQGREICFNSNEDTLTIVDVTSKQSPVQLARQGYGGAAYSHQGWLTEDQRYFLLDDELDESSGSQPKTTTYIWDLADLTDPQMIGKYEATDNAIDHNQYVAGNFSYQANYRAGLRILDLGGIASEQVNEVAFFDIYPANNNPSFNGAWSSYPYFESGNVIVSGIEQGLFVLRPHIPFSAAIGADSSAEVDFGKTVVHTFELENTGATQAFQVAVGNGRWAPTLLTPAEITIISGQAATIEVAVPAQGSAYPEGDSFTLTVTPLSGGAVVQAQGTTTLYPLSVTDLSIQLGLPNQTVIHTLEIVNYGSASESYTLALSDDSLPSQLSTTSVGPLASGESAVVEVAVTLAESGGDEAFVTVTAQSDGGISRQVELRSAVVVERYFLPLVFD